MDGMLHLYIGDGKGKSTAALGLALRASGAGLRLLYCQFLKQENSSELVALARLPQVTLLRGEATDGFLFYMDETQRAAALENARTRLKRAACALQSGEYDLVILDEALWLLDTEIWSVQDALDFVSARAKNCELVLTGGRAPEELIDAADYVSEISKVRHPFDREIPARRGIEF